MAPAPRFSLRRRLWRRAPLVFAVVAAIVAVTCWDALRPAKVAQSATTTTTSCTVLIPNELLITDLSVVEGSRAKGTGQWSFGGLISRMCPQGQDPGDFVEKWFKTWANSASNSTSDFLNVDNAKHPSAKAAKMRAALILDFLASWPRKSNGKLDVSRSPMRLLAVINRLDLGQGRFAFVFVQPNGEHVDSTLILEYELPRKGPNGENQDLAWWAKEWHSLSSLKLGSTAYLTKLATITERFAGRGKWPGRPNGSALNQIRSNEQFGDTDGELVVVPLPVWELRDFRLDSSGQLAVHRLEETPHFDYNIWNCEDTPTGRCMGTLEQFLVDHEQEVLNGTLDWDAQTEIELATAGPEPFPFVQWFQFTPTPPGITDSRWDTLRQVFGEATCNGCHQGNGQALEPNHPEYVFTHLLMREAGEESVPSAYLKQDLVQVRVPNVLSYVCPSSPGAKRCNMASRPVH